MRLGAMVFAVLLVLTAISQMSLLRITEAESTDPAITACAVRGGDCLEASPDSTLGSVLSHMVLEDGCASSDLHVMRYIPEGASIPVVATWCT